MLLHLCHGLRAQSPLSSLALLPPALGALKMSALCQISEISHRAVTVVHCVYRWSGEVSCQPVEDAFRTLRVQRSLRKAQLQR